MNVLTTTWRQLVSRRLWPVALLLVAALVAVPMLLKKDPEPIIPAAPATSEAPAENAKADDNDAFAEPVVAKASSADRSRRRRVLGSRKDPFEPAPVKKPKKKKKTTTAQPKEETKSQSDPPASTPSAPSTPSTPVAPAPQQPKKPTYAKGSLIVRFGTAESDVLPRMVLPKLGGLPKDGDQDALLVYTGLTDHGRKARFLVDASLEVTGDGTCEPHPSNCETIDLAAGETEFLDVIDPDTGDTIAQYELDVVKIN